MLLSKLQKKPMLHAKIDGAKLLPIISNLILGLIIAACIVGIDQIYRIYNPHLFFELNLAHLKLVLILGFLLSFLQKTRHIIWIFAIMVFLLLLQLIHYSYFGASISPIEISLFFTHSSETLEIFSKMIQIIWIPLIICVSAFFIVFFCCRKLDRRFRCRYAWILLCLFFLFPSLKIVSAIRHNTVGKPSKDSVGDRVSANDDLWFATQKLILFYSIYTLPHQFFLNNSLMQPIQPPLPLKLKNPNINIIVVMGESLTSTHMSIYGYNRPTTPFLDSLKLKPNVNFKLGISAGVATDVSLPMFFNMAARADSSQQIYSKNRNLFKLAKKNGFETYFISAQDSYRLNIVKPLLLPGYIEHFAALDEFTDPKNPGWDNVLVNYLKEIRFSRPTFLVLHQHGSHAEYFDRYPPEKNFFHYSPSSSFQIAHTDAYDNSVRYTDEIMQQIVELTLQKTERPTYIIFTSDHGESLGIDGVYGHNNINYPIQHFVPIIFIALNGAHLDFIHKKNREDLNKKYMSHYELSQIVASLLGYKIDHFSAQSKGYSVTGGALSGLGGFIDISFDAKGQIVENIHTL